MEGLSTLQAMILGLVQGLSEFLPISSSGHLALLQHFFGVDTDKVLLFTVLLHMGTLISVCVVYWKDIVRLIFELVCCIKDIARGRGPGFDKNPTRRLGIMIIVATIPTAIIGLLFNDAFENLYSNIAVIGCSLIITGCLLWIADHWKHNDKHEMDLRYRDAIFVGLMQGIAITPGISRSGSTIFGSLLSGIDKAVAVRFAFLISIPSILGSFILEMPSAVKAGTAGVSWGPIAIGVAVAAVSGWVAIKAMIKLVTTNKLSVFSFYTWAVGLAVVIYAFAS